MEIDDLSKFAQALGKKGGLSKSPNKIAASRINGKKGGRPKAKKTTSLPSEKLIKDINKDTIYCKYIEGINTLLGKKYKGSQKDKIGLMARLKEGRTLEEILTAVKNASKDSYHIGEGYKYLTPEFFTRADKIDKFLNQDTTKISGPGDLPLLKNIDYAKLAAED